MHLTWQTCGLKRPAARLVPLMLAWALTTAIGACCSVPAKPATLPTLAAMAPRPRLIDNSACSTPSGFTPTRCFAVSDGYLEHVKALLVAYRRDNARLERELEAARQ
jgi:hypothetical protein